MAQNNDTKSRLGVAYADTIFSRADWIFREQPIHDWGVDAQVEPKANGKPTGQLIALQIKTGASFFKHDQKDSYTYYGEPWHLDYWTKHCLPVFIIIHEPETQLTLWQKVEVRLIRMTDKGWAIQIPKGNVLNPDALPYFAEGVASDPGSFRRSLLALDYPLMLKVQKHETFLQVQEMNHKGLSMRGAWFRFDDEGKPDADLEVPRWHPESGIHNYMARMFPWLEYAHTEPLLDPRGEIEGEVHKLKVGLNRIGRAFVQLEDFFQNGLAPQDYEVPFQEGDEMDDEEYDEWFYQSALEKDDG